MPQSRDSNGFVVPGTFTGSGLGQAIAYTSSAASPPGAVFTPKATITSTGVAPSDGDTVVIGSKTYTFKTTLTPTEGEVLINVTAAAALLNLSRAINHLGTPNTDYKCAAANADVTADLAVTGTTILNVYAIKATSTAALTTPIGATLAWSVTTLGGFSLGGPQFLIVMCTTAAFIATGVNPTATVLGRPIAANTPTIIQINPGDRVSAIQSASGGTLNIFEVF